jgi:hypothetical protein
MAALSAIEFEMDLLHGFILTNPQFLPTPNVVGNGACGEAISCYPAPRLSRKTSLEQTPHEQRTIQLRRALA